MICKLGWNINDHLIEDHKDQVHNLVNLADVVDSSMIGKLSIYLLLVGFTVKIQLNK